MRLTGNKPTLSPPISTCREMAIEAESLAAADASSAKRAKYLDLARQWTELADEMERAKAALDTTGRNARAGPVRLFA